MGISWDVVVGALVGLLLGAVTTWAHFATARERQAAVREASDDVSRDESSMLAAIHDAALILSADDAVLRANAQALHFGLARLRQLTHPEMAEMVRKVRETGHSLTEELALQRGPMDGAGHLYLQVHVAPLARDRIIVLCRDQTPARRLDQTRRDFVANVSHELKTPVGAIQLLAETVADSPDDPEVVERFANQMKREAARLATLVQEIIDLSRLQEPDALVEPTVVDIDSIILDAVDRVSVEAARRSISIVISDPTHVKVLGDANLLTTAVRNLLDNAVNYSPDDSQVSVGVRSSDGRVRIAVVDQGIGIDADAAERVFERFYRVDTARARSTGGTGLGLSIVKHIARDHGGEVTVWSRPGNGSTFTLILPEHSPENAPELAEANEDAS